MLWTCAEARGSVGRAYSPFSISDCVLTTVFSVGEGVEGRRGTSGRAGLGGDEAERGQRQAIVRREIVQEAAFAAVGENFVVDVQENLRRKHLDLKAHLVMDAVAHTACRPVCSLRSL